MKKQYSQETLDIVLGNEILYRTPLHIAFSSGPDFAPAQPHENLRDEGYFNAIGSLVQDRAGLIHLPVIDVDGGVEVVNKPYINKGGFISKAILMASHRGEYGPHSDLRDVLGDNGIDLEVFHTPVHERSGRIVVDHQVGSIVLRSKKSHNFECADSTTQGHGHLYIQQEFHKADHLVLVKELGKVGIVSPDWQRLTEEQGMGIVRTPWTKKNIRRHRMT